MSEKAGQFRKVATWQGWDYWQCNDTLYEIVPEGSESPNGGYTSKAYILEKLGMPDCFKDAAMKKADADGAN